MCEDSRDTCGLSKCDLFYFSFFLKFQSNKFLTDSGN